MKNVSLTWSASPASEQVTQYNIYHALSGGQKVLLTGTAQNIAIVYPDQLGYTPGQVIDFHVAAVNATGEGALSNIATVQLPAFLALPSAITDLVAVLV